MEPDWQESLPKAPARVFVGSTIELFDDWVEEWMWESIWQYVNTYPQHTFIFLTKRPENLIKWSPFPDNCWVGISAINTDMLMWSLMHLEEIRAKVKFVSLEPLLDWSFNWNRSYLANAFKRAQVKWVIIGQKTPTSKKTIPQAEWVKDIVHASDEAKIPVFLKDNLNSCEISDYPLLLDRKGNLRQEFPRLRLIKK
jgi:protein gp37